MLTDLACPNLPLCFCCLSGSTSQWETICCYANRSLFTQVAMPCSDERQFSCRKISQSADFERQYLCCLADLAGNGKMCHRYKREPKWKRIPPLSRAVELLHEQDYLPAIWFIFSRASCDKAAQQVHASGADLTSADEQAAIQAMLTALK